ncbi:MAG: DUF2118 domain-containing protein [Desulfurococcales archaeon]|nr:DUF2118 domain-containing protein [Desulfurococcales archaeon]
MEYTSMDYQFPRAYLDGYTSVECLVPLDGKARIERPCKGQGLGLAPYEQLSSHILDPVEAVVKRRFALYIPWLGKAILVEPGTRVSLVEAFGVQVNHRAREGDTVRPGTILAYILTGKGETRTLRAGVEGIIVYIAWGLEGERQRYIYVIAPSGSIRILEVDTGGPREAG